MSDTCVVCNEPSGDQRCTHCGAARAPGGYRVERLVAQTPHSRLYLATSPAGDHVALKELLFALVPGARELDAFEREARLLRELSHPRIPRFVASFQEGRGVGTRLYLAQEFVDGESLADRLKTRRFSESETKDVGRQLLLVLDDLHARTPAIIHRDVKPANVLRRDDGTLVLVDFGAARNLANEATHRATLVGTYGYMPPEQMGGTVDATADLYAVGATLLHLVTGRSPADLAGPDGTLAIDPRALSPTFVSWLKKLSARMRADRYQSAREALAALDAPAPVPPRRKTPAIALAVGTAAVALLALVIGGAPRHAVQPLTETPVTVVETATPPPASPPTAPSTPPVEPGGGTSRRTPSRPAPPMPGVDIVKLERVQDRGARKSFTLTSAWSIAPGLTVPLAEVPRRCGSGGSVRLERLGVELADDGTPRVEVTLDGATEGCIPDHVRLVLDAGSAHTLQHARFTDGTAQASWAVPLATRRATLEVGSARSNATLVRLDLEGRTASK